jgi:hypothetical protein
MINSYLSMFLWFSFGIRSLGWFMAERVGFEPTLEFPPNTLSKRAPSATRPSLQRILS